MSLVDTIIDKAITLVTPESKEPVVLLEGCDQLNRIVRLFQSGKKHWVEVNKTAFECKSLKDAELEFDFRINESNRNI